MLISTLLLAGAMSQPRITLCSDFHSDPASWKSEVPPEAAKAVQLADTYMALRVDGEKDAEAPPKGGSDKAAVQHERDVKRDIELGQKYAEEIAKELKFSEDKEMIARVERIGSAIAAIANKTSPEVTWGDKRHSDFPYTFKVVKDKDVNAFSIPGGIIYVYEGLLNFAESDDELAGVLAHEVSHAAFRHVAEMQRRSSKIDLLQIPLILAAILSQSGEGITALQAGNLVGQSFKSGWSLNAEQSADWGAIQYMKESNFNPLGVLTLMERLAYRDQSNAQINWGIYASHPPSKERAQYILAKLNALHIPVKRSEVTTSLRASTKIGNDQGIELFFGKTKLLTFRGDGAIERSEDALKKINRFTDKVPGLDEVSRDGYTVRGSGRPLFEVKQQDMAPGEELDASFTETLNRFRAAIFDLNYRIWTHSSGS